LFPELLTAVSEGAVTLKGSLIIQKDVLDASCKIGKAGEKKMELQATI
jgi:hypothetical protein